jgi:hypothetical protein
MSMMKRQKWSAPQRGMPVEDVGGSSARLAVTGETVSFFYSSSGTRTADAGQAIGVVVEAVLAYAPIASSTGDQIGVPENTSLSFTSTAFTSEIRLSYEDWEQTDGVTFAQKLTLIQTFVANKKTADANGVPTVMANGDYVVDYRHGTLIGKKASTQTTLTSAAYKTVQKAGISTVSQSTASSLNAQVVGNVASDAADSGNPVKAGSKVNVTSPTFTDGDRADLQSDINGYLKMREQYAPAYENNTTGRAVVEHNYTMGRVTADGSIKASAGFVHTVTLSATGAVTAGVITLYANTAESGTVIWSGIAQVAMNPVTILLDVEVATGIYVGYDGTVANVATSVSYR